MNCTIVIEQTDNYFNEITTNIYTFDDYRIAVAIQNLLDNINDVHKDFNVRPIRQKGQ